MTTRRSHGKTPQGPIGQARLLESRAALVLLAAMLAAISLVSIQADAACGLRVRLRASTLRFALGEKLIMYGSIENTSRVPVVIPRPDLDLGYGYSIRIGYGHSIGKGQRYLHPRVIVCPRKVPRPLTDFYRLDPGQRISWRDDEFWTRYGSPGMPPSRLRINIVYDSPSYKDQVYAWVRKDYPKVFALEEAELPERAMCTEHTFSNEIVVEYLGSRPASRAAPRGCSCAVAIPSTEFGPITLVLLLVAWRRRNTRANLSIRTSRRSSV